jgi:Zn-dependent peptidase ImmA (M78 family)/transcriptional regulator with XRE-family HTH domain
MLISDEVIGWNIQQARYRSGLSQSQLADSLGVDRTVISKMESGSRSTTAAELVAVAEALNTSLADLTQLAAGPRASRPSLRNLLLRGAGIAPYDHEQLIWAADVCEALPEHQNADRDDARRARVTQLSPKAAGELAARTFRKQYGLSLDEPVTSMSGLAGSAGIAIVGVRMPSRSHLSGASMGDDARSLLLVNLNHPLERQRFTVAHEIAHCVLDGAWQASACDPNALRSGNKSTREIRADVFASALLLPKRLLDKFLTAGRPTTDHLIRLQRFTRASRAAIVARLRDLGYLSSSDATLLRGVAWSEADGDRALPAPPAFRSVGITLARVLTENHSNLLEDCVVLPDREVVP